MRDRDINADTIKAIWQILAQWIPNCDEHSLNQARLEAIRTVLKNATVDGSVCPDSIKLVIISDGHPAFELHYGDSICY